MAKEIKYGAEARAALEAGVNKLIETVRTAPLAQLVEQLTLNQWVPGSSP